MKNCSAAMLENVPLDPRKLPNYVFGMVLGPTDFRQVLENFDWKHRNSNLLLHGSGTVCGLKVSAQAMPGGTDAEIAVSAGFAISPRGRWIRVERDQCAALGAWLLSQKNTPYGSPGPGPATLYVTLCYNQCLTDLVPIAGQQCSPDAANQAYSRILETFNLQFSWTPPAQPIEDRARMFGALLRRIEILDEAGSLPIIDDSQALFEAVRALIQDPLPLPGSLPDLDPIRLNSLTADASIREALTLWVTEICPAFRPRTETSPLLAPAADDCLLLAAIDFTVNSQGGLNITVDGSGQLVPGTIVIDETERPVIVPSRLLQELFEGGGGAAEHPLRSGTVTLAPGGKWTQFATATGTLPSEISPDARIDLAVEGSDVPLLGATAANVALTLHRPPSGPPVVAATYLSKVPANLTTVTVRWHAYQP
jgi:hypothetical protein